MNRQMDFARFAWVDEHHHTTCIETAVDIACAADRVFDYVTNPSLWNTWHPATVAVRACALRPLVTGESLLETIAAAGRRVEARWTVLRCDQGRVWIIGTDSPAGAARITYTITAMGTGCRFHRTLEYRSKHLPWKVLDSTLTKWLFARQSKRALENLKSLLEWEPR